MDYMQNKPLSQIECHDIESLNAKEWKEFAIGDLTTISAGKRLTKSDMNPGNKPFIGASDSNNGVTAFVSNTNTSQDRNVLGVNYNGSVAESFYHPYTAIFTDDVKKLSIKEVEGNKYHYLFIKNAILQQKSKYQYAYKLNEARLKKQKIMLPIDSKGNPDWPFMEQYIKTLMTNISAKYVLYCKNKLVGLRYKQIEKLEEKKWHEFFLKDIFETVQRGKRLTKTNQTHGLKPYISSTALNNGIDNFIGNRAGVRLFSDCLTIANSGSVGSTFYHSYEFIASDHVTHLKNSKFNSFVYLFIATQTSRLSGKYNFNREINDKRISRDKIMLPVNDKGEPDYEYMEQFMMNLEYKKREDFIEFSAAKKI